MNGFKVFSALAMLACGNAWAEVDVARVAAGEVDKVRAILGQQQRNFGERCAAISVVKATALVVTAPVIGDAKGKPTSGRWMVRYSVDACGSAGFRNVDMTATGQGIAIEALAPGETMADARLQADVVKSFGMASRVAMPACKADVVMRDTKIRARPAKPTDRWQELWVGRICGRDMAQMVEFMPTKGGTTFKMSLPVATSK